MPKHPAKFSKAILALANEIIPLDVLVLDPFAGTGLIHTLEGRATIGNELEYEWAAMRQPTIVGDATRLAFRSGSIRWLFTSPTYGNRFSDHHEAKDGSLRHSYTHTLGRKLTERNTGAMPWGKQYREMHILAWVEVWRVMARRGRLVLNVSNFIKDFEEVDVVSWHTLVLEAIGFRKIAVHEVKTRRMKQGSKKSRKLRSAHEYVIVFEKP